MLYSEQMKQICEKLGVNPDECKDGLYSTLLQTICDACDGGGSGGGDVLRVAEPPRGESVKVGQYSFYGVEGIKKVVFPVCNLIGQNAFDSSHIEEFVVEGYRDKYDVTAIESEAFRNTPKLKTVDIALGSSINNRAFYGSNIEQLIFSRPNDTLVTVGNDAFAQCKNLHTLKNSGENKAVSFAYVYASAFNGCENLEQVYFDPCFAIGVEAFNGCTKLKTVILAESVPTAAFAKEISESAFSNCTSLTTLILDDKNSIWQVNLSAFYNTPIGNGQGHIYVRDAFYETYRTYYEAPLSQALGDGAFDILFRKTEDYPEICG